eukprot:CAMPEP_0198707818 /NCGR_PEP_ID=MMETSP1471-20131121/623_1 /TAXON_ID=41880 /ORGANISM="Pycnococcus provasolii, Strain RCC733" /LENGTH=258 /DNA_ID=CAMNT_0044466947 /DNA_START=35 /DNA_END=812 /DNA_ORIENTATION=-
MLGSVHVSKSSSSARVSLGLSQRSAQGRLVPRLVGSPLNASLAGDGSTEETQRTERTRYGLPDFNPLPRRIPALRLGRRDKTPAEKERDEVEKQAEAQSYKSIRTHDPAIDHVHRGAAVVLAMLSVCLVFQPTRAATHIIGSAAAAGNVAAAAAPLARLLGAVLIVPTVTMASIPGMALHYKSTRKLLGASSVAHLLCLGGLAVAGAPTSMAVGALSFTALPSPYLTAAFGRIVQGCCSGGMDDGWRSCNDASMGGES